VTARAGAAPEEAPAPPLLTRAAIVAASDLPTDYVDVPEWGGRVKVRAMTGTERDRYDAESAIQRGEAPGDPAAIMGGFRVRMLAKVIVDEDGNRLFGDSKADIAELGSKSGDVLDRIYDAVLALSKLSAEAQAEAKDALGKGQSDGSGSA
jgi:hypothetical protein